MEAKKNITNLAVEAAATATAEEFISEPKSADSKVISEIKVNLEYQWPTPRERFVEDYTYCALCGDELIYTHNTHFANHVVSEEAHCPSCNIRTKSAEHGLQ